MVSLYVPGSYPVARIRAKLDLELSTAVNIKDAVNRASVQQALRSCLGRLAMYKFLPKNGLAIFSGTITNERGKRETLTHHLEPPSAISNVLYRCGAFFDTEILEDMLVEFKKFGFIVVDGHSAVLATVCGGHT